jgi:hypothetical protein
MKQAAHEANQIPLSSTPSERVPRSALDQLLITELSEAVEGVDSSTKASVVVPPLDIVHTSHPEGEPQQRPSQGSTDSQRIEPLQPLYTDEDLAEALAAFEDHHVLPPRSMHLPLTTFAHSLINERIEKEDYDTAQQLENALRALNSACQRAQMETQQLAHGQLLVNRLQEVKEKQTTCDAVWEQRIADFKSCAAKKLRLIEEKHEMERTQFEKECQCSEFLQKFTKSSSQLLQLWRLQKSLAQQRQFAEAKHVKKQAEELQRQETAEAEKRAIRSIQQHYMRMILRQKKELECAEAHDARKLRQMEAEMKREKEAAQKLNKQMETRIMDRRTERRQPAIAIPAGETRACTAKRVVRVRCDAGRRLRVEPTKPKNVELDLRLEDE